LVIITYNISEILVRKHQLPFWFFKNIAAMYTCLSFLKLNPYILERQKTNLFYAKDFEWLYNKIQKKQKSAIMF